MTSTPDELMPAPPALDDDELELELDESVADYDTDESEQL